MLIGVARRKRVAEVAIALGGIAVASQGESGLGRLEGPAVVQTDTPALLALAVLHRGMGKDAVEAEGSVGRGEHASAEQRQIVLGQARAEVGG